MYKPVNSSAAFFSPISQLLLCALLLSGCSGNDSDKAKKKSAEHLVETVTASYQNIAASRTLTGTLQAIREVSITSQTQGLLMALPVYPGDKVSAGQLLAQLDDVLIKAEVQKARASLNQAELDLKRLQDLAPRKLASESDLTQARTRRDIAKAELKLKQTQLEHTQITAPIDGIISARLAEPGDVIALHGQLLHLIDTSSLKAEIHLSELLLPLIDIGNPVDIQIDALGTELFSGKIQRIYPTIDKNTRRGTIEVVLQPVPEGALAGQLCRVTVHTQGKSRLMIPYDTVRHDKQGDYIFILNGEITQRVEITTGLQHLQQIEVLSGLDMVLDTRLETGSESEEAEEQIAKPVEIISKGFFALKDKMKVKKVDPPAPNKIDVDKFDGDKSDADKSDMINPPTSKTTP